MTPQDTITTLEPFQNVFTILDVIKEANRTLETMVAYEAQYKCSREPEIQKRIFELCDFIKETEKMAAKLATMVTHISSKQVSPSSAPAAPA